MDTIYGDGALITSDNNKKPANERDVGRAAEDRFKCPPGLFNIHRYVNSDANNNMCIAYKIRINNISDSPFVCV